MNASKTLTSLGAAAAALLLGTTIAFASPAQTTVTPTAAATNTVTIERRGGPPTPTRPTTGSAGAGAPGANLPDPVGGPLSDEVAAAMTAGILDEWHAYAVYDAVIEQFGAVRPFTNIQRAEAKHADAWATIFERYDVLLPTQPDYAIPEFASLTDACSAAAEAEIANMDLYDQMLTTLADYPDMVRVVTALQSASANNHLPAFERCAGTVQ